MELTLVIIVGVVSIVAVAASSQRLGLAAPLSLVIVGLGLSFVPGVPHPQIHPEVVLAGVLPPLLYSAAVTMPVVDFRRNFKAISGLAVLLVVVTTVVVGCLLHWLLPGIGWPAAFAVGAVVSPTDAVAATAVGRRLGLPSRLLTVLEGEGLVNDASALVLLRSAVAALAASVSLWSVVGEFIYAVVVAVIVGAIVGFVNVRVRALLKDSVLNTAISFVIPFIAFLPAEELNASGVLSVVVAGVITGHQSPRHLRAQDRMAEAVNWRTLAFLLESSMFLVMGLSLKSLVDEATGQNPGLTATVMIGLLTSGLVIAMRVVFTVPLVAMLRRDYHRAASVEPRLDQFRNKVDSLGKSGSLSDRRKRLLDRRFLRVSADVKFRLNEHFGWRGGVVLAWAGMRGAITVAAAHTLPAETPLRSQLILIAFVVAVTTLLLQGLSLPTVIKVVKVPGDDPARMREDYRNLLTDLTDAAVSVLDDPDLRTDDGRDFNPAVVERVRADARIPNESAKSAQDSPLESDAELRDQYLRLRLRVLYVEAERLLNSRAVGAYSSAALTRAQSVIDVDIARTQRMADSED